jgi:hypothetical protein
MMKANHLVMLSYASMSFLLLALVGCGGSGGGNSTPGATTPVVVVDPNLTVPLQTGMANLVNNGFSKTFSISGWIDNSTTSNPVPRTNISGSGNWAIGTPVSGTFNSSAPPSLIGTSALFSTEMVTGNTIEAGVSTPFTISSTYGFNTSNYTLVVTQKTNIIGDTYILFYSSYTFPATVKAGAVGMLGSGKENTSILPITSTSTYQVTSDRSDSLLVTFTEVESGGSTTQKIYRVNTLGTITPISITISRSYQGSVYKSLTYTFA